MGTFRKSFISNREEQMPYFYFIGSVMEVGIKTYTKMQSFFESPKSFYEAGPKKWESVGIFSKAQLYRLNDRYKKFNPYVEYGKLNKEDIRIITYEDSRYPERLRNLSQPPVMLFLKGRLPDFNRPSVAVIGARACSNYGCEVAALLGETLASYEINVFSGMARGVDSLSQIAAVKNGGYSLAVLGGGIDVVYPRESQKLYDELCQKGGIVSEYAPGTAPQASFFAIRNRIISGLSDVVCVVEAREKSGTMITVDAALEQGKDVYVVPGRITDVSSRGCHELIKQGAQIITDIDAFCEEIVSIYDRTEEKGPEKEKTLKSPDLEALIEKYSLNEEELSLISKFDETSFTVDEACNRLFLESGVVLLLLLSLNRKGLCDNLGAGRFKLNYAAIVVRNAMSEKEFNKADEN